MLNTCQRLQSLNGGIHRQMFLLENKSLLSPLRESCYNVNVFGRSSDLIRRLCCLPGNRTSLSMLFVQWHVSVCLTKMQIGFRISQQRVCTGMEKNTLVLCASLHLFPFSENYVFYVVILFYTEKTNVFADFDAVTYVVCKIVCIHLWYLILSLCKVTAFFRVRQTNQTNSF